MLKTSLRNGVATLALATLVAAGMTAAPFSLSDDLSLKSKTAEAKNGNGGGNDKGGRGGNDKGGKGGNGKGGNSANTGTSTSSLDAADEETEEDEVETAKKKGWGSLSASNASQRAREMAAEGSQVNNIADYEAAMTGENPDPDAAAAALAAASNKEITPERVAMVNNNLGIEATPEEEADLAAQAEAIRSGEGEPAGEGEGEESTAEGEGEGEGTEEGVDEIAAAAEDLIGDSEEGDTSTQ